MPSSQPGAAAHETSNLTALLLSRLLSVRRRPAVLLGGMRRPGDRCRAKPGPSGTDSRHPSKQDRSRSPQRARLCSHGLPLKRSLLQLFWVEVDVRKARLLAFLLRLCSGLVSGIVQLCSLPLQPPAASCGAAWGPFPGLPLFRETV